MCWISYYFTQTHSWYMTKKLKQETLHILWVHILGTLGATVGTSEGELVGVSVGEIVVGECGVFVGAVNGTRGVSVGAWVGDVTKLGGGTRHVDLCFQKKGTLRNKKWLYAVGKNYHRYA